MNLCSSWCPGLPFILLDVAVFLFVAGHALELFLKCWNWRHSVARHLLTIDTLISTLTTLLFVAGMSIWIYTWNIQGWNPKDIRFRIADSFYCVASVLCFFRFTDVFSASRKLGKMELSLTAMLEDVFYFAILVCFVFLSFATGIRKLYSFYAVAKKRNTPMQKLVFLSLS